MGLAPKLLDPIFPIMHLTPFFFFFRPTHTRSVSFGIFILNKDSVTHIGTNKNLSDSVFPILLYSNLLISYDCSLR